MTLPKIEETLYDLLIKQNDGFVISLNGEWGIGKTYFWNNFLKKYNNDLKEKQVAYVSLFGNNSLNDIRTSIILQSSPTKKKINFLNEKLIAPFKNFKNSLKVDDDISMSFGLNSISSLLSLMTSGDFKNVIVCFDDFERISSKLDLKDVLGLISELKEQKQCKIVMILNETELDKLSNIENENYSEIFGLYKEKIIDSELPFEPTTDENFKNITKIHNNIEATILKDFFNIYNVVNIRVMNQVVNKLNNIFNLIDTSKYNHKIQHEVVYISARIFLLQIKFNLKQDKYIELKKAEANNIFKTRYGGGDEESLAEADIKDEDIIKYIDHYTDTTLENILFEYIDKSILNTEYLKSILDKKQSELSIYTAKDEIINSWHKLHVDFKYTKLECANTLWKVFKKHSRELHNILNLDDFNYYNLFLKDTLSDYDENFAEIIIKQYIDKYVEQEKSISVHEEFNQKAIEDNYPDLLDYWNTEKEKKLLDEITIDSLEELLEKVTSGWGEKDQYILNNIKSEDYKKYMIDSPSFVKSIIKFLSSKRNDTTYFPDAIKSIKQALEELYRENDDYKFKVNKIAKETQITLNIEGITSPSSEQQAVAEV